MLPFNNCKSRIKARNIYNIDIKDSKTAAQSEWLDEPAVLGTSGSYRKI